MKPDKSTLLSFCSSTGTGRGINYEKRKDVILKKKTEIHG